MTDPTKVTLEYRVVWKRSPYVTSSRIYQRYSTAHRKAVAVLAIDKLRGILSRFDGMDGLCEGPTIESRPVGIWSPVDESLQVREVQDVEVESVRNHYAWTDPGVELSDETETIPTTVPF
jgi:hypothetical protein